MAMSASKYEVVIVGAGPAGITAAITLARAGVNVLVLEGGVFPGAENWSGAVYFTENLAHPDVLGEAAVRDSAFERPVTKRGAFIYNGHSMVGVSYRNPDTFRHCYTVLRPTYDHYLAELAKSFGATILCETTATGLLRDERGRITGVHTDRGSVYADVVFLAEGDASHLVTKEGYERCKDTGAPHFLQGICEVIELDPGKIERHFGLSRGEGAAFEIILRNGSFRNKTAQLNMGGFIYTNAASVSLGLVLPLDNLAREFGGDHNRLMEWFKSLPDVQRLTGGARSVAYGAKIIRGGGFRELPQLVDDGLALGGACTGIGIDFPYPNFTGPATAMGRLFAQAVRQAKGDFSRHRLTELYEKPVRETHYFKNIEFLQDWPHYVEHTRVFFGRAADLACGSLYVATNPDFHAGQKLWQLAKFLRETLPPKHWREFFGDLREQRAALGLNRATGKTHVVEPNGEAAVEFYVDGKLLRSFPKFATGLRAACDHLYRNDKTPLPVKLRNATRSARLIHALPAFLFALAAFLLMPVQWLCEMIKLIITRPSPEKFLSSFFQKYKAQLRKRTNLDAVKIAQSVEEKLSLIRYFSDEHTHINVIRPEHFEDRTKIAESPLWHVCPAKVYEDKVDDLGQVQIVVNFENCIKCESCLRGAPADVDWTRTSRHQLIFSSPTPANRKLLQLLKHVPLSKARGLTQERESPRSAQNDKLEAKLRQFRDAVATGPRYVDAARARWLMSLVEDAPARIRDFARQHNFFWAAAEARALLETPSTPSVSLSEAKDLSLRARLDALFSKQTIKHLEHGKPFTPDQLAFLKSLTPTPDTLRELARKDPSLAALVSGLFYAQITARPELADVPWIGLTAARTHGRDFPGTAQPTLQDAAAGICAIALGAGDTLLERARAHATSRVQFPGLFKDEDARDGIAKFGAVKALLSEMEARHFLLEALPAYVASHPAHVKILASEAFGPDPGSFAYNAGQILGGTAYSEDDIFSKFYRDSACFAGLLFDNEELKRDLGPDADAQLARFALDVVKKRAGENPSELEAEIVQWFECQLPAAVTDTTGLGARVLDAGYIEKPLAQPPRFSYRAALDSPQHYDHGDFLVKSPEPGAWRYVPEMLFADAELRAYHEELYRFFIDSFWNKRFDGQPYYRLVERLHMVPLPDVREMIRRGFMRMYIPRELGGEARLKAHYYILCPLSMRYADPSYSLTIMASTSIGTTPILLGLNQDLPKAKSDLQEFLADTALVHNLKSQISNVLRMLDSPEALKVKKVFMALGEKVKTDIGKKPMLRAVASEFLARFMDAGRAGLRMDLPKFKSELNASLAALDTLRPRAEAVIAELDRRAEAARFYLRLIAAGQISAFALTEPSAGSDSGGIQTRAQLKRVEVLTDAGGAKYFMLGTERRELLDAGTVDVTKIDYAGYDYATSSGLRAYEGRAFHDIAQIRRQDGREWYEYYELNGAKMWITNGHVAGVMCLYARTPEGPTGFLVDRYAEGLVVGKDEEKMGQRGSPTNELGLTSVRVPRENIIGIEGRGQVNALDALNAGRTGLCVSATAMTAKILDQMRAFARERGLDRQPWAQQLLGEVAMELFASESLAFELIGLADHHGTKSARTESAIGKYYASEVLHRAIRGAEKLMGIEAATHLHEIEKHRRDARVLNIYEGTNEVQRFLILKDLVDSVLPKATGDSRLFCDLKAAVDTFGAQVWQNASFQPTMFKLAQMAGYLKTIDSVQWRVEWLRQHTGEADADHRAFAEQTAAVYVEFARREIDRLHAEFEREFALLKEGLYPPAIRIAMLALQVEENRPKPAPPPLELPAARRIAVVVSVAPVLSPQPRVADGELLETHFEFDRAALERALATGATVSVWAVAPRYATDLLRRALALGAADATLIETEELPGDVNTTARLLARQVNADLVLCSDPLLAIALEGNLGFPCVFVPPARATRDYRVTDYVAALGKTMKIVPASELSAEPVLAARYELPAATASEEKIAATPESAAALVRKLTGASSRDGEGLFSNVLPASEIPRGDAAVFLGATGRMEGVEWMSSFGLPVHVVVLENPDNRGAALAALQAIWKDTLPQLVGAGVWANELLARFACTFPRAQVRLGVTGVADGAVVIPAFGGKVQRVVNLADLREHPLVATFAGGSRLPEATRGVYRIVLPAAETTTATTTSIADAEFIIDVGYAIRNRENFDAVIAPLRKRLEEIGVKNVALGGTRKVVEELKLLASDRQIGQTGTAVNPRIILSIGVSGAPQHVDYIGDRATIVAFNKDPDAPLMTLNQRRARPKVVPIVGDLYETVPRFVAALKQETAR
jgi:electron transfer flavoprotein-quinone oxidoreductase